MKNMKKIDNTKIKHVDYKDVEFLKKFTNAYGRITARKHTGLTNKNQKKIEKAIKRARYLALMPFVQS